MQNDDFWMMKYCEIRSARPHLKKSIRLSLNLPISFGFHSTRHDMIRHAGRQVHT